MCPGDVELGRPEAPARAILSAEWRAVTKPRLHLTPAGGRPPQHSLFLADGHRASARRIEMDPNRDRLDIGLVLSRARRSTFAARPTSARTRCRRWPPATPRRYGETGEPGSACAGPPRPRHRRAPHQGHRRRRHPEASARRHRAATRPDGAQSANPARRLRSNSRPCRRAAEPARSAPAVRPQDD